MNRLTLLLLLLGVCAPLVIGGMTKHQSLVHMQEYTGNCGTAPQEGDVLTLGCEPGQLITSVDFASYGTPGGDCQQGFTLSSCHADSSMPVVAAQCVGKNACEVPSTYTTFGVDPCYGTYKHLSAKVTCRPPQDITCGVALEGQTVNVACSKGKYINRIDFASFGTPAGSCPSGLKRWACHASNSESVVTSQCQYKTHCSVLSSNTVFGDPCYGTHKWLAFNVSCVPEVNLEVPNGLVDEGATLYLQCGGGRKISMINFASYGTPKGTSGNYAKGTCHAANSVEVLQSQCLGKSSCQVVASNDNFGGDPCYLTPKQLAASVTCSEQAPQEITCATAAEGQMLTLSCSGGRKINSIPFASYGTPAGSCPSPSGGSCHASTSKSVLEGACLGKQTCSVAASYLVYGDPCYGTHKKMMATATCA